MVSPNKPLADLHAHYESPDSARRVIRNAAEAGVKVLGLLAKQRADTEISSVINEETLESNIIVLPGMELVTVHPGKDTFIDLIAVGYNPEQSIMSEWLGDNARRTIRADRAKRGLQYLQQDYGFNLPSDNETAESTDQQSRLEHVLSGSTQAIGLELGKVLFDVGSNEEAFSKLTTEHPREWQKSLEKYCTQEPDGTYKLREGFTRPGMYGDFVYKSLFDRGMLFEDKSHVSPAEAIRRVHEAGGVIFYSPEGEYDPTLMDELAEASIDGVMAYHGSKLGQEFEGTDVTRADITFTEIKRLIKKGLIITGGSDYQGKDFQLGKGAGDMLYRLSPKRLEQLQKKLAEYGSKYANSLAELSNR